MSGAKASGRLQVLELSEGVAGAYCGWLMKRTGADVTQVASVRPSLRKNDPLFVHFDSGKVQADLPPDLNNDTLSAFLSGEGQKVDVIFTDLSAGARAELGIDFQGLASAFPGLVVACTSTFGESGPNAAFPAQTLDAQAASGVAWAIGDPNRSPLGLPADVVECQAGVNLAAAIWLACLKRDRTGRGSMVDVALADILAFYAGSNCTSYIHHGLKWHRAGRRAYGSGGAYPYVILPCQDGEIGLICRSKDEWGRLIAAMGKPDWSADPRYNDLRAMGREYPEEVDALLLPWLAGKTRAELTRISIEHGIPMAPLRRFEEVIETPQFKARGFLSDMPLADGGTIKVPNLPYQITRPTPDHVGRHTPREPAMPKAIAAPEQGKTLPLQGLRVLDLGWVWSAPMMATILAEFGAEVIKVEHGKRLDNTRLRGRPLRGGKPVPGPSIELSPMIHQINHGKKGITLNLKQPRAIELLRELVSLSDVLIENMSPGALNRIGLGYDEVQKLNPAIVMISMSAAGQKGPSAAMRAYAPVMSAFAGLESLVGYPGEKPIGALNFGLGDPNAAMHAAMGVLAALHERTRSGTGCYLDLSQIECLLSTMPRYLIDASLGRPQPAPGGNRHPEMAPHGIFPASGTDRWVSISVPDDECWKRLKGLAEGQTWAEDPALDSASRRIEQAAALEDGLAAWTRGWERDDLVQTLRRAGIPASPVLCIEEQMRDPHFQARGLRRPIVDPDYGPEKVYATPWRFDDFEAKVTGSSPRLGEHNRDVFETLLGLSKNEVDALIASDVIS